MNLIAEIGCNHKGDLNLAKMMIKKASECGADVVKFQKRDNKTLLDEKTYNSPHPNPINSYGETYGEHREYLEFNIEEHDILYKYCNEVGVVYSTSVWDLPSAKEIIDLNPALIKIPSACNTNYELVNYIANNYKGEIHISFGMTTKLEEKEIHKILLNNNCSEKSVLYSCTSGYPVEFEDLCLLEISRIKDNYKNVKAIGFSGHHLGIAADIAAMTLGATWIERHFTIDRTWKGTDHAASLEPQGFSKLSRDISNVNKALNYKKEDILDIEKAQRKKLKFL